MTQPPLVYVDMDDVLCQYSAAYAQAEATRPEVHYPQSEAGFFQNLEPMPGGVEAMNWLDENCRVYILTAPSMMNPLSYTEKRIWVEEHLGYYFVKRLIISPNKGLLKGDFLIDDHVEGRGQQYFEGALLQFGSAEYPDWGSVLEFFQTTCSD